MFQEICNSSQDPETSLKIRHLKDHSKAGTFILKVGKSTPLPLHWLKKQKNKQI